MRHATSRELVAAKHGRLVCNLKAQSLFRYIGYRCKFEASQNVIIMQARDRK